MRFKLILIFLMIKLFNIHICDQTERSWQPDYFKSSERQVYRFLWFFQYINYKKISSINFK